MDSYIFEDDEEKDEVSQRTPEQVEAPLKAVDTEVEMVNGGPPSTEDPSIKNDNPIPLDEKETRETDAPSSAANTDLAAVAPEGDETMK